MSLENNINITLQDLQGEKHNLTVPIDMNLNLMEAIRLHELPIKATCGGMAMCATCHVHVLSDHVLSPMGEEEEAMLDEAFVLDEKGSRLACQIKLESQMNGLEVALGKLTES